MPSTHLGRICCRLALAALAGFAAFYALVATGQRGGETFFSNPLLTGTMAIAASLAVAGAATGIVAITRKAERAWSVMLATGLGLFVLLFAVAEALMPH